MVSVWVGEKQHTCLHLGGESALSRRCAVLEKRGSKAAFSFSLPHVSFSLFSSYSCPFWSCHGFPLDIGCLWQSETCRLSAKVNRAICSWKVSIIAATCSEW